VREGACPLRGYQGSGSVIQKICENTGTNLCNLVHVWGKNMHFKQNHSTSAHQKWYRKLTLFRATFKSGTEFTVAAYRFRGP